MRKSTFMASVHPSLHFNMEYILLVKYLQNWSLL